MGYGTRNNGRIRTFWPDNTETEFYAENWKYAIIHDLLKAAAEHFKTSTYELMEYGTIESEKIHTNYLGYDLYDASDYTYFIKIEYKRKTKT